MLIPKSLLNLTKQTAVLHKLYFSISKSLVKGGPAYIVKQRIAQGQMKPDHKQAPIVNNLQEVYENIQGYSPGKFLSHKHPKGLYIYGSVGAGKTMLMDIFFNSLKGKTKRRRSHFNDFMTDVHSRIHRLKKKPKSGQLWSNKSHPADPIAPVARELVKESWLLCFDEFQVTDIADAMILKRLFTEMFDSGMVMVATSNRAPDDLYKNGLQRVNFLPFIPVLKKHCNVVNISGKDYRTAISDGIDKHYFLLREPGTKSEMEGAFNKLCKLQKKVPISRTLNILGHKIVFKNTCGRVLYASFEELCERPLGAADYIEIARQFDIILLKDVPLMNLDSRNQARRFILLIDTLYDNGVKLKMSAAAPPNSLFSGRSGGSRYADQERVLMDDLRIEKGSVSQKKTKYMLNLCPEIWVSRNDWENAKASLFSGSEEVFAFQRTVSRITEMCSNSYWTRHEK